MKRIRVIKPVQGRSPLVHRAVLSVAAALRSLRDELKSLNEESPRYVSMQTALQSLETSMGYLKLTDRYPGPLGPKENPDPVKAKPATVVYHACRPACAQICEEYQQGASIHGLAKKYNMSFTWVQRGLKHHKVQVRRSGGDYWQFHLKALEELKKKMLWEAANRPTVLAMCPSCQENSVAGNQCLNAQCEKYQEGFTE